MRCVLLGVCLAVMSACGPRLKPDPVMTPDEALAEQERLAEEQERKAAAQGPADVGNDTELESDKKAEFDERQAKIELSRAARSASTCPDSVSPDDGPQPKGEAEVSLVFDPAGHVKSATINEPFAEKAVGKCALRAMKAIIVPNFAGAERPMTWKVDLTGKTEEKSDGKKKKK